jgi:hypothetical protein
MSLRIADTPEISPAARAYGRANDAARRLLDCERARLGSDPDLAADPTDPRRRAVADYGVALEALQRLSPAAAAAMDQSVKDGIRRLMSRHAFGADQAPYFSFTGGRPVA